MKAVVTSVDERTTDLCVWSLERNGFEVVLYQSKSSLWEKLKAIYSQLEEDFIRVDADVIVNRNCKEANIKQILKTDYLQKAWWVQFQCWGWYTQDLIYGGVQLIKKEALPDLRQSVDKYEHTNRPETALSRIEAFYNPRKFESYNQAMGIHGYGIKNLKPIIKQKANRGQSANYDFELAEELNKL